MESQDPILPGCEAQKQHCSDSSITVTGPGKQRLTLALRILSQIHPRGCFRMKSSFGCMWTSLSSLFYYYFFLYSWKWLFAQNILSVGCPGKKKVNKIVFFFHAFGTSEDPFLCKQLVEFFLPGDFPVPTTSTAAQLQQENVRRSGLLSHRHGSLFSFR